MSPSLHGLDYAPPDASQVGARKWAILVSVASFVWLLTVAAMIIFQTHVPWEWREPWFAIVFLVGSLALAAAAITMQVLYRRQLSRRASRVLFLLTILLVLAPIVAPAFLVG